jgi:hypothetical protein
MTENNPLLHAVAMGNGYRVSKRFSLGDGEEFIVYIDPSDQYGTIYMEPPAIEAPDGKAHLDVYEGATPANLNDTLEVHNMRYDGKEFPSATIEQVPNGDLDTTDPADKTEETFVQAGGVFGSVGGAGVRGIWRVIPTTDVISIVITDQSGGSGNSYAFDTVVYEGKELPN